MNEDVFNRIAQKNGLSEAEKGILKLVLFLEQK